MTKKTIIITILAVTALLPLWMWLGWVITPKKKLVVAIVDKTVLTKQGQEHISLNWVLNHQRFTKTSTAAYSTSNDYFGFFPLEDEHFKLKGLERFTAAQLDKLSDDADLAYFTDTYGIFNNEWYTGKNVTERSGKIYGGMSKEDIGLMQRMKDKHKLIITEFNSIGSPTEPATRALFEEMFSLKWSGWIGRFFSSLDTSINKEIPHWLIRNYKTQHNNQWPFKKSGVALVSSSDELIILEEGVHLGKALPMINTTEKGQEEFDLPASHKYAFWFDIMQADPQRNEVMANFQLDVNEKGKQLLAQHQLPAFFPAVTRHIGNDYRFYYFSADFCDNPISLSTANFKGIAAFQSFMYSESDPEERKSFFWKYYRPLVTKILSTEYQLQSSH